MYNLNYQMLVSTLALEPDRIVFIRDFGPALIDSRSLSDDDRSLVFSHYFDSEKKQTITELTFGKVVIDYLDFSPESQFVLAYMEACFQDSEQSNSEIEFIPDSDLN